MLYINIHRYLETCFYQFSKIHKIFFLKKLLCFEFKNFKNKQASSIQQMGAQLLSTMMSLELPLLALCHLAYLPFTRHKSFICNVKIKHNDENNSHLNYTEANILQVYVGFPLKLHNLPGYYSHFLQVKILAYTISEGQTPQLLICRTED